MEGGGLRGGPGGVTSGRVEWVPGEPLEPPSLDEDRPRGLLGAECPLRKPLRVPPDRRQRRLQLVAHRQEEVLLALTRGGELFGQLVERLCQRAELTGTAPGARRRT